MPAMQAGSNTVYDQPPSVSGTLDHLDVATEPTFKGGDAPRYGEIDMASPHTPAQPLTVRSDRMGQGSFSRLTGPSDLLVPRGHHRDGKNRSQFVRMGIRDGYSK